MANKTTYLGLLKPTEEEYGDVAIINENMDVIDDELHKRGTTVNGEAPDEKGNYQINEVPAARQLVTDETQQVSGEFIARATGGHASVSDGTAKLNAVFGRSYHEGKIEEALTLTVNAEPREPDEDPITATINRDTFVAYVSTSGTITLTYTDAWSSNPTLYGVTVTGTPIPGDEIVIVYVKEERGTITNSQPTAFTSTGWNLYNHAVGYARVVKYSNTYGFLIGGAYTGVKFSPTLDGEKITITPTDGFFVIPSDGYIWVIDGNATDTYVLMTWSNWASGPEGGWKIYTQESISLASAMANFANGLMSVGGVADEINLDTEKAYSRIERMTYNAANLAVAKASGRPWDADEEYIYLVREAPIVYSISIDGDFTADDHGMEIIDGTTVAVMIQAVYGENLVDKLRTDLPNEITTLDAAKMDKPTNDGTLNQIMRNDGEGGSFWGDAATEEEITTAVAAWLTAHPEATTTVQDGTISRAKLNDDLKAKTDAISDLESTIATQNTAFAAMGLVVYNGQFYINPDGNTLPA